MSTTLQPCASKAARSPDPPGRRTASRTAGQASSASAQTRQNLALLMALKGDPDSAERLARKDLPADVADNNNAYFRMISAAAKGAAAPSLGSQPTGQSGASAVQ